ncbi:hypothetical protein AAY473_040484 [Plecturocebus cupreus]
MPTHPVFIHASKRAYCEFRRVVQNRCTPAAAGLSARLCCWSPRRPSLRPRHSQCHLLVQREKTDNRGSPNNEENHNLMNQEAWIGNKGVGSEYILEVGALVLFQADVQERKIFVTVLFLEKRDSRGYEAFHYMVP